MKRIASNGLGRISSGTVMATCLPIRTAARGMDDYLAGKNLYRDARSNPIPISASGENRTMLISGDKNQAEVRL